MRDEIPSSLTTPDEVKTSAGTFVFADGMPTAETVAAAYDRLDHAHGIEAFTAGLPAVSQWAVRKGYEAAGIGDNDVLIFSELMDCRSLFLTANADTVYFWTFLDLSNGPLVVTVPERVLCAVDDMWWRWVTDLGIPGPDRGAGGDYLFAGPGWDGPLPEGGVFVCRSRTTRVSILGRAFLQNDDPAPAVARIKDQLKITPYTAGGHGFSIAAFLGGHSPMAQPVPPRAPRFVEGTGLALNTIPPNDYSFYELLDQAVQNEPASALDPEVAAPIRAIGIVKGQPFDPDSRMRAILTDAVATANALTRATAMAPRESEGFQFYPGTGSQWTSPLFAGGYSFQTPPPQVTKDGIQAYPDTGAKLLNARAAFLYLATGITPAMCMNLPRIGSQYIGATVDANRAPLEGGRTYTITLPPGIPAEAFWSLTVYDNQTRSMLVTGQRYPRAGSQAYPSPAAQASPDGSTTIWLSPRQPGSVPDGNWIQTIPGRNWFTILRFYSPLPAFFDRSWQPTEIQPAD